jgi:hypothetical protein
MHATAQQSPSKKGDKRPIKIREIGTGKTIATTTTVDKGVAAARRANEAV